MESDVFDSIWLLLMGIIVGLLTRKMMSGKAAYGTVADMLLGVICDLGSGRVAGPRSLS